MITVNNNFTNTNMRSTTVKKSSGINESDLRSFIRDIGDVQDRASFSNIFRYFAPRLKSFFVKLGCTETQAEEIIQEVMISIWTKAKTYNSDKSSVSTWVYTIAKNKRIDKIRKEKKHYSAESDESLEIPIPSIQEDQVIASQISDKINKSISYLPKEQAELLNYLIFMKKRILI